MVVERKFAAFQQNEIFDTLTSAQLSRLFGMAELLELPKHHLLFAGGAPSRSVYFIERGSVRVTRQSPDGQSLVILMLFGPGDILGDALWEEEVYDCCAETLEEAVVLQLPRESFENFIKEHPIFALRLIRVLGFRLRHAEARIEDLIFRQVPSRVAKLFLELAEHHGKMTAAGIVLNLALTHQEIADTVGSSRVTVTQILNQFRSNNWIGIKCKRVTIRNIEALEGLVTSEAHTRKRFRDASKPSKVRAGVKPPLEEGK